MSETKLRISTLTLTNFKSWYGTNVIDFRTNGLACIVGANGSGKSNIIDALLFVFGWRAKQLRQDKLADLIHYSENEPDFAKVEIVFESSNNEFEIGRTVRSSGTSYYEINNTKSTLESVEEYLLDNGLDIAHNRFLILQGEVEEIAMMKPCGEDVLTTMVETEQRNLEKFQNICNNYKVPFSPIAIYDEVEQLMETPNLPAEFLQELESIEPAASPQNNEAGLLEFIEAVVGTERYLTELAQQSAVCEFLSNEKSELRVELSGAVQHRDAMNDVKNEARDKILKLGESIKEEMNSNMFMASSGRVGIEEANEQIMNCQTQINEMDEKQEELAGQKIVYENEEEQSKVVLEESERECEIIEEDIKSCDISIKCFQEKEKDCIERAEEIQEENTKIADELKILTEEHETFPQQNTILESQLQNADQLLQTKEAELNEIGLKMSSESSVQKQLLQQLQLLEEQIQPVSVERVTLESQEISYEKLINQKLSVFSNASASIAYNLTRIYKECEYKNPKLQQINQKILSLSKQIEELSSAEPKDELLQLKSRKEAVNAEYQELSYQLKELEQEESDFKTSDKLIDELLKAEEQKSLHGIHGRLGTLGKIDEQLNLAAIAAFGSELDLIVCDSMDTIEQCLTYIRQNNLGVASFLDLTQITSRFEQEYRKDVKNSEFIQQNNGQIFLNLVQTQEIYFPAFWHVMGETVVSDNIDSALIINKGVSGVRSRTVTLTGELFEKSGTLTGGGNESLESRFKGFRGGVQNIDKSILQRDVEELEEELNEVNNQLLVLEQREQEKQQLTEEVDNYKEDLEQVLVDIAQHKDSIISMAKNILQYNENINFQEYSAELNNTVIDELQTLLTQLTNIQIIWENDVYIQKIPNIIELAQYYEQQKFTNEQQFEGYVEKHDNFYILESEDSILSNLVQFEQPLQQLFNIAQNSQIQQQIEGLVEQEVAIKAQIAEKQQQLDQIESNKEFKNVKKTIAELQRTRDNIQQKIQQLQIRESQFDEKMAQIELKQEQQAEKLTEVASDQALFKSQIQELIAQAQIIQNSLEQEKSKKQQLQLQHSQIAESLQNLLRELKITQDSIKQLNNQISELNSQVSAFQQQISKAESLIVISVQLLSYVNEQLIKIQEKVDYEPPLLATHQDEQELTDYDNFVLATFTQQKTEEIPTLEQLKAQISQDIAILTEFSERENLLNSRQLEFQNISEQTDQQIESFEQLREQRADEFSSAFQQINEKLREIYRIFSLGGDAVLELENHFDPFEGIIFSVMPPKKAWRQIENLSGGEKTLSSLALIFALHEYKENFIYCVDELDAALDYRNVSLIANYIKELSKECQFIIISLRNNTFEVADRLIGVYKVENCSNVAILDVEE